MSGDLFDFELEPDDVEPEEIGVDLASGPDSTALVEVDENKIVRVLQPEVMPDDFKLPALIQFVPNMQLRVAVESAAARALAVVVTGNEGIQAADAALDVVRASVKKIESDFADPKQRANKLHKWISSKESEWTGIGEAAIKTVGARVVAESARLQAIADDEKRRAQKAADDDVRARTAAAAQKAEKRGESPAVVNALKQQAQTATAPPVAAASAPVAPANSTIVKKWKTRFVNTKDDDVEQQPSIADLNDAQRLSVIQLCKAVIDGKCAIAVFKEINWGWLDKRAESEGLTMKIPGIEVVEVSGLRAKPKRGR